MNIFFIEAKLGLWDKVLGRGFPKSLIFYCYFVNSWVFIYQTLLSGYVNNYTTTDQHSWVVQGVKVMKRTWILKQVLKEVWKVKRQKYYPRVNPCTQKLIWSTRGQQEDIYWWMCHCFSTLIRGGGSCLFIMMTCKIMKSSSPSRRQKASRQPVPMTAQVMVLVTWASVTASMDSKALIALKVSIDQNILVHISRYICHGKLRFRKHIMFLF